MPTAEARHGRLPWPAPEELDPERRAVYHAIVGGPRADAEPAFQLVDPAGRLEGPFNAMLVTPQLGQAVQELGAAIRYRTALPGRCREIAILTLASERQSDFEWYAHAALARRIGLSDEELTALVSGGEPVASYTPTETLVCRAVRMMCRDRDLDDQLHAALTHALGLEQLNELITLVGYYDLLALSLRVWRTPLPDAVTPAGIPWRPDEPASTSRQMRTADGSS